MLGWLIRAAVIAVVWMLLTARVALDSALLGFVLGLALVVPLSGTRRPIPRLTPKRLGAALAYSLNVLRAVLASDLDMARRILTPGPDAIKPGMFELPVGSDKAVTAALSAHALTVTPGSIAVDFPDGNKTLLVHVIDIDTRPDIEAAQQRRAQLLGKVLDDE